MKTFAITLLAAAAQAVNISEGYAQPLHQHSRIRPVTGYETAEVLKYRTIPKHSYEYVDEIHVRQVPETVYDTVQEVITEEIPRHALNKIPAVGIKDVLVKKELTHEHSSGSDLHDHSDGLISLNTNSSESSYSSASDTLTFDSSHTDTTEEEYNKPKYYRHPGRELLEHKDKKNFPNYRHVDERQDKKDYFYGNDDTLRLRTRRNKDDPNHNAHGNYIHYYSESSEDIHSHSYTEIEQVEETIYLDQLLPYLEQVETIVES